ncbi:uncharacterized protein LOC112841672 [Oreochromis niloticus]|uniref:uncharacterized protein LOC112841672 n=1 Tax=Oreochromis niloticus TaxID=8128 RepID=UPI000DF1D76C|nr:uncharacterized protein LOC112841672 [Oreochromis niloticus]
MWNITHAAFTAMLWNMICVIVASAHEDHKNITTESGQNITLPCRASNMSFIAIEWSRFDLKPEYVLLSRDGHFDPHNQHLSFENRVDLQDRKMKDGDVSLILKNVTTDDTGTYECHVFMEETRSWKSISIIYLSVDPPGPPVENRPVGLIIGVIVGLSAVVIFVACLIYKNPEKRQNIFLVPSCHERIRHCFCRRAGAHVTSAVI